jgi:hypothetical protein
LFIIPVEFVEEENGRDVCLNVVIIEFCLLSKLNVKNLITL